MLGTTATRILRIITLSLTCLVIMAPWGFAADDIDCNDESIYCINDAAELQAMSEHLTDTCYLMGNIDAEVTATWNDGAGFLPIDNFTGVFDGQGYTISGLTIARSGEPSGLFGTIIPLTANVAIKDVALENVSITGTGDISVGALIGSLDMAGVLKGFAVDITDCKVVSGIVSGTGNATGGLVGSVESPVSGSIVSIKNCSNMAAVSGVSKVGGLAGFLEGNVTVETCRNTGDVTATGGIAAGLIAYIRATRLYDADVLSGHLIPVVTNCYARGTVRGYNTVGGFVAVSEGVISYCYCAGHVVAEAEEKIIGGFSPYFTPDADSPGAVFIEDYFDKTLFFEDHGTVDGLFEGIDGLVTVDMNKANAYDDPEDDSKNWDLAAVWAVEDLGDGKPYPFFRFKGGDGSLDAPYRIGDVYGLQGMGADRLAESSFILISDVDAGITKDWNDGLGFSPVGATVVFSGNLSGQGFVIHDLNIKRSSTNLVGLFAALESNAVIDHIIMENAMVVGQTFCGILVGYCQGTVTDCSVSGSVSGWSSTGGLVGILVNGVMENCSSSAGVLAHSISGGLIGNLSGSSVVNCTNRGTVYGNLEHAGGLVGRMTGGSLSGCMSKGAVYGSSYVGGLVGTSEGNVKSLVDLCASASYVSGDKYVGGFAGLASGSFQSCLSSGTVIGTYQTGGFVGALYGEAADCMSTADVTGARQSGGFAGFVSPLVHVTRCYSKGRVAGTEMAGGFIGLNGAEEDGIQLSFWDVGTSGLTTSDGGQGLASDAMMQSISFTTWDFVSPWAIIEGITRPYLDLPMAATDLGVTCSGTATRIDDGGTFNVDLTVTNIWGRQVGNVTLEPSFDGVVEAVQYSLDGGETWVDLGDIIEVGESLAIGQSRTIQVQGRVHAGNQDTAAADWAVDFEGIDPDQSDNNAGVTWDIGPENLGDSDTPVVYGGDGSGCFIQSVNGI